MGSDRHRARGAQLVFGAFAVTALLTACGSSSSSPKPAGSPATTAPAASSPATPAAPASTNSTVSAAVEIVHVLHHYEGAYSRHDLTALQTVLSPSVTRYGAGTGGCDHSTGRPAVLADYQAQFSSGTGTYRLIHITPQAVTVNADARTAAISLEYHIAPVSRGRVNFKLANTPAGWKITDITATCRPAQAPENPPTTAATSISSTATVAPTPAAVEAVGSTSHAGDAQFCSTHMCIPNFPNGNGTVVQCEDGEYSHSGGLQGACSDHGGEM